MCNAEVQLTENWSVLNINWEHPQPQVARLAGIPCFIARHCECGNNIGHSLPDAVYCGLLRDLRTARGHTMQFVADKIGVNFVTLWRWEHQRRKPHSWPSCQGLLLYIGLIAPELAEIWHARD